MRRYLTEKHQQKSDSLKLKQEALEALRGSDDAKHIARLFRQIKEANAAHQLADEAPDIWECSCCKKNLPSENKQVAVEINQVTAPRGDEQPLIKDYPPHLRPHLYLCRKCALKMGIVTDEELKTGIRAGRFLK